MTLWIHTVDSCKCLYGRGEIAVDGCNNLYALEIETAETVESYSENTRYKILDFLKYTDIPIDPAPFVEAATTNTAFEESVMFDNVMDVILANKYDFQKIPIIQ
jgi:arsenite-transporting ATPase